MILPEHVRVATPCKFGLLLVQVLNHTEHLMRTKGHAVIVVAEGCGDTLIQSSGATDAGSVHGWPAPGAACLQ